MQIFRGYFTFRKIMTQFFSLSVKMKKLMRILLITVVLSSIAWILLTVWVQRTAANKTWQVGNAATGPLALIVFNPDQFIILMSKFPWRLDKRWPNTNSGSR